MAVRKFLYQDADIFHAEQDPTDELSLGKITLSGVGGVAVDSGGMRIIGVGTPTADQDAVNKAYADAAAYNIDWKNSVRVATTGAAVLATAFEVGDVIDGITLVLNDRVLIKDQTLGEQNGIYTVNASGAPTRAVDADAPVELNSGLSVFIEEGTVNGDSGWTLITDGTIVVNTTPLVFTQFTGLGQITAGEGLTKTGNTLDIGDGAGILVTANAIEVELATNPALEFDAAGAGGKLRFKPDTSRGMARDAAGAYVALSAVPGLEFAAGLLQVLADPTGGIQVGAAGVAAKLNGTTLQVGASGLSVKGLPSLFEINAIATGATVTAANLGTLTNGSNADALHIHAAATATIMAEDWTAGGAITKGDGLYVASANHVSTGDSTNLAKSYILGVAGATVADTNPISVVRSGLVTGVLSGATPGARYFLGTTGAPVLAGGLAANARTIQLGIARTSTDMTVQVFDYGKKAA